MEPPCKTPRSAPLLRNRTTFEFLVRYPHGSTAISGYRRAARHFGLHTKEDPAFEGSDAFRIFVHKDPRKLRALAKAIGDAYATISDNTIFDVDYDIITSADVAYFEQDWRWWDETSDREALKHLGWKRRIRKFHDKSGSEFFRLTLQHMARRR